MFIFLFQSGYAQSIVINEVSQGSSGNQEYVEFLVTGPALVNCTDTPPCIDLRGYIFDDNNGYLNGFPTSGVGIAAGACRFSNDLFWACIPAGTLIVIYNDADVNGSIPPQDIDMADGNCAITIPVSSALFEKHTTLPSSANSLYAAAGWVSGGSWTNISMANAADGFQIYAPSNTTVPVFSIGWGPTNNLGDIYMGSGSAAGNVFYANDCDYFNQASWIDGSATTDQSPGSLNMVQASCAGLMNANCNPPTVVIVPVDETCTGLCDGSATATVTGGMPAFVYSWSPAPGAGQGTATISGLCGGTSYTLTLTNDNGNGCILTENVTIGSGAASVVPTFAAVAPICSGDALAALPTTSINGITGTWSPALNNTATTTYTFTPTAGQCATTTTLTITVNPNITPTFAAVAPICSGDALTALPTTSTNSITGTWSPAIDNTATTTYTFTPTAGQCATTTTLTITVNPNVTPTFAAVAPICSGDALAALPTTSINGITGTWSPAIDNTATTTYTFTPTVGQCATTTTLTITVNPVFSSTENFQICAGSNYTYPDGTTSVNIVADETHISVLAAINSCDSLVTTTITVVNSMTGTESAAICSGSDYTFPDGTIHTGILSNESYVSTLTSVMGCDSLVTTNIIVNPVYNLVENTLICENTTYFFPDGSSQVITANTSHISNLTTALGCDSSITTNITMTPVYAITENATVCENTNYLFPDGTNQVITASVTHVSSLFTASGCDSVVTTVITMNPVYTVTETVTICDGDNYTFPDGTVHAGITTNENYTSFFSSITGCDSIIITMLEVQPLPNVLAGADQLVCNGASVTLSATGAATYSWSGGVVNGVPFMPTQLSQSFTVTGTDNFGCQNSDDVLVDVNPELSPFFTSDVTAGCAPLTVSFENLTSGGQTCLWNFGDGSYSSDCSGPVYTYTNPGSFDVTLTLTDNAGCTFTNTLFGYITVAGTPDAAFYADRYVVDDLDSEVDFTNNSTGASWYEWYFGDGTGTDFNENPSHIFPTVAENGTYLVTLVAGNSQNCMDTAQALITVNDVIVFYVPNVFTPDGDSFNETFQPVFTSGFDPFDYHLIIFNRWGELIFESFNAAVGWSGTYSDEGLVTDDVYVWKIEFRESMSDKRHDYLGHVTVLK